MTPVKRRSVWKLAAGMMAGALPRPVIGAPAAVVRILTSFPPGFFEPFREAFEARHPDLRVEFLQRKTTTALARVVASGAGTGGADLFWASAPDAFELLKAAGRLARTAPRPTGAPERIAGQPVNDTDGTYLGFAVSAYGLVYSPSYLAEAGLQPPERWEDLAAARYHGHLGLSPPSRSGTTHIVVEALLQRLGWEAGWRLLRGIGGNLATVTARSFGVTSGVARGRFGIGVSIDFLAAGGPDGAGRVRFTAPAEPVTAPASIGILADAPNPEGAERFVDFLLSAPGQALLQRPGIGRTPLASPAALARLPQGGGPLDHSLSARRYELINLLFDEAVTHRQGELSSLARRLHAVEAELLRQPDEAAAAAAAEARDRLFAPPLPAAEADDAALQRAVLRLPRGLPRTDLQAELEARLRRTLDAEAARAAAALRRAEGRIGVAEALAPAPGR